jgi:cation diffusion facilitator family transporter
MISAPLNSDGPDHVFGQDQKRRGESRTVIVVVLTLLMMVVEIGFGWITSSIALIADGLHMASHAAALGVTLIAYVYVRRLAADPRYSFGTGKINALAGFASATMLGAFALAMLWQSVWRLLFPVPVQYDLALIVAFGGLIVNGASVFILGLPHADAQHAHDEGDAHAHHHDHNLRAAYLHVLADALTSVLAIVALLVIKFFGLTRFDPMMGIVGSFVVSWWAIGLMRDSAAVLLDRQASDEVLAAVRQAIEQNGPIRVTDLHVWSIGPGIRAAELRVDSTAPQSPDFYKRLIPRDLKIVHATVEVGERFAEGSSGPGSGHAASN